jgi:hypothetical protein
VLGLLGEVPAFHDYGLIGGVGAHRVLHQLLNLAHHFFGPRIRLVDLPALRRLQRLRVLQNLAALADNFAAMRNVVLFRRVQLVFPTAPGNSTSLSMSTASARVARSMGSSLFRMSST